MVHGNLGYLFRYDADTWPEQRGGGGGSDEGINPHKFGKPDGLDESGRVHNSKVIDCMKSQHATMDALYHPRIWHFWGKR